MCAIELAGCRAGGLIVRGIFVLLLLCFPRTTMAINDYMPVRYNIPKRQMDCIYRQFSDRDAATFSVFVLEALDNGKPLASITFDGPVALMNKDLLPRAPPEKDDPSDKNYSSNVLGRDIFRGILKDWPRIGNPAHPPRGVLVRKFKVDWTHAGESEDAAAARAALQEENHEEFRKHALHDPDSNSIPQPLHLVAKKDISPYEETHDVLHHGIYRLCVETNSAPLIVEMDIRSANEMRGVDPGTGHVWSHQRRQYMDEQAALDTIDEEPALVQDEDFTEAKVKLKYMHDVTSEIMKAQHERMHRIRAHDADARRGAVELAWSSKMQTLLFAVITVFQVYTFHRWLLNNNLLGGK